MAYVVVLMSFADTDELTLSGLLETTGFTREELQRVVSVLIDQKLVLLKHSEDADEPIYCINLSFTQRHPKMRLLSIAPPSAVSADLTKSPGNVVNLNASVDQSMDLDQSTSNDQEQSGMGRAATIKKHVLSSKEHVNPQNGFTCMDILRCVLAHPDLQFTPSPNEIHLCLQRLVAMGTVVQLSHLDRGSGDGSDVSHVITYKFSD